ncbi:MAG: DNA polymerase III subunit delta [Eubacteriales bacterium]
MDYKQLMKEIKNSRTQSIYLFYGEEDLLGRMMLDHIKEALIQPAFAQMNVHSLDGKTISVDEIIHACETLPFMNDKRMVIVYGSTMLNGNCHVSSKDIDELCHYLENIPDTTQLLFINQEIDKKRKLFKTLQKRAGVVEYNKLQKNDLMKWIHKRITMQGKKIHPKAIDVFIEHSDYLNKDSKTTLFDIENEIEKLVAFSKDMDSIQINQVQCVVQEKLDTNIFRLLELMGNGRAGESIQLLDILLYGGEPPIKILYMLIRQFRLIYHSKLLKDAGFSSYDIPKVMGEKPFVVNKALSQGHYYSHETLIEAYQYLSDIDIKMKKSQIDQRLALEIIIFKFS